MLTIGLMCIGIATGKWLFPKAWKRINTRAQTFLTILLIFSMGVSIGKNEALLRDIGRLGLDSLLFCLFPMAASILVVYLTTRKMLPRKKEG